MWWCVCRAVEKKIREIEREGTTASEHISLFASGLVGRFGAQVPLANTVDCSPAVGAVPLANMILCSPAVVFYAEFASAHRYRWRTTKFWCASGSYRWRARLVVC